MASMILPMLAHPFDASHRKHLRFPCVTQPKLDGVRMLAGTTSSGGGGVSLWSRTGKPFEHLERLFAEEISVLLSKSHQLVLDGELYVHGAGFQRIVSMARNANDTSAASKELQYWIYDVYDPARPKMPTSERMELLASLFSQNLRRRLHLVPTEPCAKEADVAALLKRHEREGYEGVMLRNLNAPYLPGGKRSNGLLKLKSFVDHEFEIVGFEEAAGKDKGTVVFVCLTTKTKTEFRVRPTGTLEERGQMLRDGPRLIGKMLTVRYQELSDDGVPRFPVGIAVRDYE